MLGGKGCRIRTYRTAPGSPVPSVVQGSGPVFVRQGLRDRARASNASLGPQKVYHCRDSAYRIFFVRDMAEIGENDNRATRDITVETFRVVRRDQSVTTSPHDKRR